MSASRLGTRTWLLAPALAGSLLRLWGIGDQIPGGDEFVTMVTALDNPLAHILTTCGIIYDCYPPFTAFYRLLLDAGVRLSELGFRAPVLASGIALLVIGPLLVRDACGLRVARIFAWMLALSPLLVLYSRMARSYMPATLLAFGALLAFAAWFDDRGGRWRPAVYAVLAPLTIYFHLLAAPLVLAPLALLWGGKLARRTWALPSWTALLGVTATTFALLAALLLPMHRSLLYNLRLKAQRSFPDVEDVVAALQLQAGSGYALAATAFWLLVAWGMVALWRTKPRVAGVLTVAVLTQVAVVSGLGPVGVQEALVYNRYLLVSHPAVLLCVAAGIVHGLTRVRPAVTTGAVAAILAASFLSGPLPGYLTRPNGFLGHNDLIAFHCPLTTAPALPPFYARLADLPDGDAIIEVPWTPRWEVFRFPHVYQRAHGRKVLVASDHRVYTDDRLALRTILPLDPQRLLHSGARFLIVHMEPIAEERRFRTPACSPRFLSGETAAWRYVLRAQARSFALQLELDLGPAAFYGDLVRVWDLHDLRGQQPADAARAPG